MSAHSVISDPQPTEDRKRTAAERQRKDRYSAPVRWAGVTARSREGRMIKGTRSDLIAQVGGEPSPAQRIMIERATMLTVQLARMDAKSLADSAMSEHATREYLAWSNTLTRLLGRLGLKNTPPKARTLAEIRGGKV